MAFLIPKTKTFAMAYIQSKCLYRSNATSENTFVRPLYAGIRDMGRKPHFMFSDIAQ